MVTSLLEHERIQTTDAKAKEVRRLADRMITLGKRGTLHSRRRALRVIRRSDVTAKVFDELAERYRDRPGGYTRVLKLGLRTGDAAPISIVELVGAGEGAVPRTEEPAKKAIRRKAAAEKASEKKAGRRKKAAGRSASEKTAPAKKKAATSKKTASKKKTSKKTASKKKTSKKAPAKGPAAKKKTRKKSD
jgi:large subunit ribosomal protein L17